MLKKTITYKDYNDNMRTEDFYFNLSKGELAAMNLSTAGGIDVYYHRIVASQDNKELVKVFQELIIAAYGRKSDDGRTFDKSQAAKDSFTQTEAYSELFIELCSDTQAGIDFFNGIVPQPEVEKGSAVYIPN